MRVRDPEKVAAFNAAMDAGSKVPDAARIAGISLQTGYNYAKARKASGTEVASPPVVEVEAEQPLPDSVGDFAAMEPKKFQMLMLGEQRYFKTFAQSLTRSAPDADDLLSRTNIRVLENRHRFRPGTNFRAWMTVVMRNIHISEKRLIAPRVTVPLATEPSEDGVVGLTAEMVPALQQAPQQEAGIVVREMKAAVMALPHDQRSALVEHVVNGKTHEQIAEEAGVEPGTIKSRVHRGREALDRALPDIGALARPIPIKVPGVAEPVDPWEFVLARLYADREAIDGAITAIKKARRMANT
jgi:RNA polymerase sigma factor (sigma-70 family)